MDIQKIASRMTKAALARQSLMSLGDNYTSVAVCIEPIEDGEVRDEGVVVESACDAKMGVDRVVDKYYIPLGSVTTEMIARKRNRKTELWRIPESELERCAAYRECQICSLQPNDGIGPDVRYRVHVSFCDLCPKPSFSDAAADEAILALKDYIRGENTDLFVKP